MRHHAPLTSCFEHQPRLADSRSVDQLLQSELASRGRSAVSGIALQYDLSRGSRRPWSRKSAAWQLSGEILGGYDMRNHDRLITRAKLTVQDDL
jgi:hypothetical protein